MSDARVMPKSLVAELERWTTLAPEDDWGENTGDTVKADMARWILRQIGDEGSSYQAETARLQSINTMLGANVDAMEAEIAGLAAERDRLREELVEANGETMRWGRLADKYEAERDAALASLAEEREKTARMQAVVDAAKTWRSTQAHGAKAEWRRATWALIVAVDALDTGEDTP